jgi:hypothetical protein
MRVQEDKHNENSLDSQSAGANDGSVGRKAGRRSAYRRRRRRLRILIMLVELGQGHRTGEWGPS